MQETLTHRRFSVKCPIQRIPIRLAEQNQDGMYLWCKPCHEAHYFTWDELRKLWERESSKLIHFVV